MKEYHPPEAKRIVSVKDRIGFDLTLLYAREFVASPHLYGYRFVMQPGTIFIHDDGTSLLCIGYGRMVNHGHDPDHSHECIKKLVMRLLNVDSVFCNGDYRCRSCYVPCRSYGSCVNPQCVRYQLRQALNI